MADNTKLVNWFEIPATDLERARLFYERVFDIEMPVHELGGLRMAWFPPPGKDATGSTGTLIEAEGYTPSHGGTMVYLHVDDIEETLRRVQAAGGTMINEKLAIGQHGFVGHFEDSEGNRLGLHANA